MEKENSETVEPAKWLDVGDNVGLCRYCGEMEVIRSDDPNLKQHCWLEDDGLCPEPEIER
jgi:hypothetical protein